jgi:replicative DNA helicase
MADEFAPNTTDWEAALVTAIINHQDIRTPIKLKITHEFFSGATSQAAYMYLTKWFENPDYGDTPSWEAFADSFTGFVPLEVNDSIHAICDKLRERKLWADMAALINEIAEKAAADPVEGFKLLNKRTVHLNSMHAVDDTESIGERAVATLQDQYFLMKEKATGLKGYAYPWPALNTATLGLRKQQLVILYGRPKTYKTTFLLEIANKLWNTGLRPIIFSQEMSPEEIIEKFVALVCRVNFGQMQRGTLPLPQEFEFVQNLEIFSGIDPIPVARLPPTDACLIDLKAKIEDYRANVVILDGLNYLSTDWKELAKITRGLKRLAQEKDIPIVATTHANRSRGKNKDDMDTADDFAFGDTFFQTADVAIRLTRDVDDIKSNQVKAYTSALRSGSPVLFTIHTFLCENMSQKAVIHSGESEAANIESNQILDAMLNEDDLPEG